MHYHESQYLIAARESAGFTYIQAYRKKVRQLKWETSNGPHLNSNKMKNKPTNSTEYYIASFPKETQVLLKQMRAIISKAAPRAQECIAYQMPAFKLNGPLVYFAGYEKHIGFYPTAYGIKTFENEIAGYKSSKGAVQFPLDRPLPVGLITKIVKFRVKENLAKQKIKIK